MNPINEEHSRIANSQCGAQLATANPGAALQRGIDPGELVGALELETTAG